MAISRFWKSGRKDSKTVAQSELTANQVKYIDRFLMNSTRQILELLESTFMLNIESSYSDLEVLTADGIEKIERLNREPLYVIRSEMSGELQGKLHLLMRVSDFKNLGEVLKPTLEFIFMSSQDVTLKVAERQELEWVQVDRDTNKEDFAFHEQLMDTLTEMGSSLFGIFTNAYYETYDLYTHHSPLETLRNSDRLSIQQVLSSSGMRKKLHFLIENELNVSSRNIRLWCLISPTQKSYREIMNRIG